MFTAFAIGALGPRRAAKWLLIGLAGGLLFWIGMGVLIAQSREPDPIEVIDEPLTQEQIVRTWSADRQTAVYLRSIGLCCKGCNQVPQCAN